MGRWVAAASKRPGVVLTLAVVVLAAGATIAATSPDIDRAVALRQAIADGDVTAGGAKADEEPTSSTGPTATTVPAPTTVPPAPPPPPPTTAPPTTAPPPPPAPPVAAEVVGGRFTLAPYLGLGAWLDVFDWSWSFTQGQPHVGPADIDRMASLGVRTLYIQAARWDHPADLVDEDLLRPIIDRAHADGMAVVGWYLPTLTDPAADLRRMLAVADLGIEGLGVDIESRDVGDVNERNARLVRLAADLRAALPGEVLSGIVLPPVVMEDVNPNYWPGFPWRELAGSFDVWQPMAYWTNRRADSGWRDGYAYTAANIDRIRDRLGWLDAPIHPVGGIGDATSPEQIAGMVQAALERGALGGSIYDYRTTGDALWEGLQRFNG